MRRVVGEKMTEGRAETATSQPRSSGLCEMPRRHGAQSVTFISARPWWLGQSYRSMKMMTETMNESLADADSPAAPALLTDHEISIVGGGWSLPIEQILDFCGTLSHLHN